MKQVHVKVGEGYIGRSISVNKYGDLLPGKLCLVANKMQAESFTEPKYLSQVLEVLDIPIDAIELEAA